MKVIGPKAYIHLDRLKNNICIIKKEIGNIPLMCVIKADAYGQSERASFSQWRRFLHGYLYTRWRNKNSTNQWCIFISYNH